MRKRKPVYIMSTVIVGDGKVLQLPHDIAEDLAKQGILKELTDCQAALT
jgi:uncharacterized protein YbaP (TraB family)